jgi:hypothetical protein
VSEQFRLSNHCIRAQQKNGSLMSKQEIFTAAFFPLIEAPQAGIKLTICIVGKGTGREYWANSGAQPGYSQPDSYSNRDSAYPVLVGPRDSERAGRRSLQQGANREFTCAGGRNGSKIM